MLYTLPLAWPSRLLMASIIVVSSGLFEGTNAVNLWSRGQTFRAWASIAFKYEATWIPVEVGSASNTLTMPAKWTVVEHIGGCLMIREYRLYLGQSVLSSDSEIELP